MFEEIHSAIDALEAVVRDLEPGLVDGAGATRLMELFVRGEHVCAAGKALATKRVADTGAYREAGQRSGGAPAGVSVGRQPGSSRGRTSDRRASRRPTRHERGIPLR